MMKKVWMLCVVCLIMVVTATTAMADSLDMSEVQLTISCVGEKEERDAEREMLFEAQVQSKDGSFSQTLSYAASVGLDSPKLASLEDLNFDGHPDLSLVVGLGTNEYCIMALWNPEKGCFDAPYQQLELGNYVLDPQGQRIICYEKSSAAHYTQTVYTWQGTSVETLEMTAQGEVYNADKQNTIGERVKLRGSGVWIDYDMQYDEAWYSNERVYTERYQVMTSMLLGGLFSEDAKTARVANVSWVNLRKQDSKSSESLAKLNKGTSVRVLATECGKDKNWTRVMIEQKPNKDGVSVAQTGYIMSQYLE